MSLSVCTEKVRITSPNGNLLSEGETRCSDIATLRNLGYTIESLEPEVLPDVTTSIPEEPIPVVEPEPVQEVIIEEPKEIAGVPVEEIQEIQVLDDVFIMQADLLINRSLELATVNVNLEAEKQQLTTQVQTLQSNLENVITQEKLNEILLQAEIEKQHLYLSAKKETTGIHPRPEGRDIWHNRWVNAVKSVEVNLELFANKLGLVYTRRDVVDGEKIYYTAPPVEEHQSYIPTSSATVRTRF